MTRGLNWSLIVLSVAVAYPGGVSAEQAVKETIPMEARFFDLQDVKLLPGPFLDAQNLNEKYLLDLDVERLLHNFRVTAGLPSGAAPLGGWESPSGELRGHSVGHYLSACALMYRSTGHAPMKDRVTAIVAGLAACQEALPAKGYNKGFLSAYPESFFDRVDACQHVWAPYYTLHKIMAGLLDAYQYCDNQQALDVLTKMADWLKFRIDRLTPEQQQKALGNEHGGMNEVLANLYAVTGNPNHLALAKSFNHQVVLGPAAAGQDKLTGIHANTQIPKFIGAAREYELTGDKRFHDMADFFWRRVALARSYVIGGHSDREYFFPIEDFSRHLSAATCETCNTYNMLKLTRHLFSWNPSAETMDFYERALYNHILASIDPERGMVTYFMSLKPGHFKVYSTPNDSFWCCTGTGMENHSKYADTIYAESGDSLFLNLFIPSELNWKAKGVQVRQETLFPNEDTTRLAISTKKSVTFTLQIRRPYWAADGMSVTVNGRQEKVEAAADSYIAIRREWRDGDKVEIRLPMKIRLETMPNDKSVLAFLYGPVVLAGEMGAEGIKKEQLWPHGQGDLFNVPDPTAPLLVASSNDELIGAVKAKDLKSLTFTIQGSARPADVTLIPLYRLHFQRYTVYFKRLSDAEWKQREDQIAAEEVRRKDYERRVVDEVKPGEQQSETDHAFKGDKTASGDFNARKWRHAEGWFSYDLRVPANAPVELVCSYWGGDGGKREFDIFANDEKIGTTKLENKKPGSFFDVEYPLPESVVKGKDRITIRFTAQPGNTAGGVFGVKILKKQ